jgi:acetolactate synthase-1/2/3 large subunit
MIAGSKILFNNLVKNNVKVVFGYSGGAILPVLNEFHNQDKIKFVMSRTELGAGFIAEGYSKMKGSPGIVMTTSGPGVLNTVTSMQNALSDGTKIMVLSGQVSTNVIGTQAFQEADVISITKKCTKWNYQIKNTNEIHNIIETGFDKMSIGRWGPVLIDLPKNIMSNKIKVEDIETSIKKQEHIEFYGNTCHNNILNLIMQSKKPLILAGQGVLYNDLNTLINIREFSKRYNIPVTTTLLGLGIFDEKNSLSLKMLGMHGSYYANKAIQNCDLLLNFGCRFDDRITGDTEKFAPNATIVHIDVEKENINKTIKSHHYINSDCSSVLKQLTLIKPFIATGKHSNWHNNIKEWKNIKFDYPHTIDVLQGRHVISTLNKIIQNSYYNYTIVADVGSHQMWAAQFIDYDFPRIKFMTSGGLGSMGFALPASIGAKIAKPNDRVICICGDGGFTMTMNELLTAIDNNINIKVLIINNSYLGMVKMWQEKFYDGNIIATKMNNPPFEKVCESLGCKAIIINNKDDIDQKLKYVLNYEDGPIVANIITDGNEPVLPMVAPGKALDDMILKYDSSKFEGDAPC